ncbi:uncharacterized protein EI90DRAFT_2904169 [Cantharellus anzutake]|uniref:uncharacterized protein n=1 Tax=Cantharellus anzutake TaxID=1750568 RepID=UPI001903E825|nr:uncharacterized protein EI90DRAFT_2904169 [Cantharellus anzutake]KAF8342063.1 hypothetical protein EI90DRAFT_2904169 [Cantharellus anzutake]
MSRNTLPPLTPAETTSGIIVDSQTLERVVPESKRTDGSVRKEIKIRPGFTPQEDVSRFRGTRQKQADKNALPKGYIPGWAPPPEPKKKSKPKQADVVSTPPSKPASKTLKRKENKEQDNGKPSASEKVPDTWDSDEGATRSGAKETTASQVPSTVSEKNASKGKAPKSEEEEGVSTVTNKLDKMGL